MTKAALLSGGQGLADWLLVGGRPERAPRFARARLRWSARGFESALRLSARRGPAHADPVAPVFILGMWRTGSTFLHEQVSAAARVATPLTWQCFRPASFTLQQPPADRVIQRPMDEQAISTHSPQEDEFAALLLGEPSVYRGFIDPRRLPELAGLLRAGYTDGAVPGARWLDFIKAVAAGDRGPLLLKSPNHTFRLPWLARRFPDARFIWLQRDAAAVRASNLRMWDRMIGQYAWWSPPAGVVEHFIDDAFTAHDALLDWARRELPRRITLVAFADLVGDTAAVVGELCSSLGLAPRASGAR